MILNNQRHVLPLFAFLLFAPLFMGCDNSKQTHSLTVSSGAFVFDSTRFCVASAEMGYFRQPKEYWEQRLRLLRNTGVNTVMVRVPWVLHEPQKDTFDFTGQNDIREFCRLAYECGLLVWLHLGPYSDAHADMGGLPWWLLNEENITLRANNRAFMSRVGNYFHALGEQLADLQLSEGGPIALIQIEEPDAMSGDLKGYLSALCDSAKSAGFDKTLLTLAAYKENLFKLPKNGSVVAVAIDDKDLAMKNFSGIRKINPNAPILCYDISRACAHRWGSATRFRNLNSTFLRLFEVLEVSGSLNTSAVIGGTSFGHIAGAEIVDGRFFPYATSYDNGAAISENVALASEYKHYADAFKRSATRLNDKGNIPPEIMPVFSLAEIEFSKVAPIFENLPQPIVSEKPLTMEQCNVGYGGMLYSTVVSGVNDSLSLLLNGIHDNVQLFVNGKYIASASRIESDSFALPLNVISGDTICLLVDAMGRVGNISEYKDYKGLTGTVELLLKDGRRQPLTAWNNYPLPADYVRLSSLTFKDIAESFSGPGVYRATFKNSEKGDTNLFMAGWGRGEVWVNGHSLGRFWNRGPQQTLYLPGCWLNDDGNELVILDWVGPEKPIIEGFKIRIVD